MAKIKSYEQYVNEEVNLKKILPSLALAGSVAATSGQEIAKGKENAPKEITSSESVPKLEPYQDLDKALFKTETISMPGKSKQELMDLFQSWSKNFIRHQSKSGIRPHYLKTAIPNYTDAELNLNYILALRDFRKFLGLKVKGPRMWHCKVIAKFEDGKIILEAYEDGNSFRPAVPGLGGETATREIPKGKYHLTQYTEAPATMKEFNSNDSEYYRLHLDWQKSVNELLKNISKDISNL